MRVTNRSKISFKEIEISKEPSICKSFGIEGTPTTIVLRNNIVHAKLLGDLDENEIKLIIKEAKGD